MSDPARPQTLLARSTLLKLGVPIAVVITLMTLLSYLHMRRVLRSATVTQLKRYVEERGTREESIFVLAEDNHTVLARALEERLRGPPPDGVRDRFDRLFAPLPDGTVRNRPEGFDGTRQVGVFIPRGVALEDGLRRRVLAASDVLTQYGPAFHVRFTDTFITLPEGPFLIYWPESPTYTQDAGPTLSFADRNYFLDSEPEKNPERRSAWSGVYQDVVSGQWVTTVTTPLDVDGRHVASVSHDVLLEELMDRTINDHLPQSYNILFHDNGEFIVHPQKQEGAPTAQPGGEEQAHLRGIVEQIKDRPPGQAVLEQSAWHEYLAVARLRGTGWNFVTVLPEHVVAQPAVQAARIVLLLGVLALVLNLAILSWVLRAQITAPLRALTLATARVSAGDFKVDLDTFRGDELGQLARAFQAMTTRLERREEELRAANEGLEQRVEERTQQLKEVHQQLVQTARRTGMAEIAANVLHNVGNVLNSVYTSSQVAKERVEGLRVDHVGRVSQLLQERRSDLATFLTEDERGRLVTPFLDKLGQNLQDERQAIVSLLEDVSRYTEHIGEIVKVQQDYARTPRMHEPVLLSALVEDALRINAAGLGRHQVEVARQLAPLPPILTDKHKLLMILVNLISNAKYALDGVPPGERRLHIQVERVPPGHIRIALRDNGVGIPPELITRIFQFGFTTRDEGHGFGLHSSALAAQEMGGSLKVHSAGLGQGATFTLELPDAPAQEET